MNLQYLDKKGCIGGFTMQSIVSKATEKLANTSMKKNENIGCGIILLDQNDRIIMGTRTDLPPGVYERKIMNGEEFNWTLAGGGLEAYETPTYCIIRELKEEFGIQAGKQTGHVSPVGYHDSYFVRGKEVIPKRNFAFIARLRDGVTLDDFTPQQGEIGIVRSFSKEQVLDMIKKDKVFKASKTSILMAINLGVI